MKKMLLVSPHFDDAVLSAGQFMADRPDAEVVTVFGGFPVTSERIKTPYDEKCGFKNAQDAVASRITRMMQHFLCWKLLILTCLLQILNMKQSWLTKHQLMI